MFFFRCFFCLQNNPDTEKTICSHCIKKFEDYKFYCCPRCSKFACSGCQNLSEFNEIFCPYSYNSIFSKIIVNAKDRRHYIFQRIFYDILYDSIQHELTMICTHKHYDAVVLSPYHKRRLFHGYWHPNTFFEKILREIKKKNDLKFEIFVPHYTSSSASNIYLSQKNVLSVNMKSYLMCDDVLTTGMSALKGQRAINKYFDLASKTEQTAYREQIIWDLFSIFRSPQK